MRQQIRSTARGTRKGFTLIELMIVVAILGILASIAIPSFIGYIRRSKTVEAYSNVANMFTAAAGYYKMSFSDSRTTLAQTVGSCTVGSTNTGVVPGEQKQSFAYFEEPNFKSLGFSLADSAYYAYAISSAAAQCANVANNPALYTFRATGDLDGDGVFSTFELAVGSNPENELTRAVQFYVEEETE